MDSNNPVGGYSDIYSLDGTSWNPISSAGIYANWMIGLCIENPESASLPVAGYDVNIDGAKKNSEMLTANSFAYDFGNADVTDHTISVDVYYSLKPESVKGGVNRFVIGATGISSNTIAKIEIRKGENEITVSGSNVTSVELVSADGSTVASAKGNTLSIDGIAEGVYVVKAVCGGKTVARKIAIAK